MKQKLGIIALFFSFVFGLASQGNCQWVQTNGLSHSIVTTLAINGTNTFAVTLDSGIFLSTDNGANWRTVNSGLTKLRITTLTVSDGNVYLGTEADNYINPPAGIFLSSDNGSNWSRINAQIKGAVLALAASGGNVFAAVDNDIFYSSDYGKTWAVTYFATFNWTYKIGATVTTLLTSNNNIFCGTGLAGIFLSTDYGMSWKSANNDRLWDNTIYSLATDGINIYAGADRGVFLSANNGSRWIAIDSGESYTNYQALAVKGSYVFVGTAATGVFLSTNYGNGWIAVNDGLTNNHIQALAINPKYIFAATSGSGVWRRPLSDFGISNVKNPTHTNLNFSLSPNPTTGIITVHIAPANILHVTIMNVLGATVNEFTNLGSTDFTFDLSKLPSGTYFARFSSAGSVINRKIVKE